jgi:hypothetical protein
MITNSDGIERYPGVDLVIGMDGIGRAEMKRIKYESLAAREYAEHVGIKLFSEHDSGLMTEGQVVSLTPRPAVVIYQ